MTPTERSWPCGGTSKTSKKCCSRSENLAAGDFSPRVDDARSQAGDHAGHGTAVGIEGDEEQNFDLRVSRLPDLRDDKTGGPFAPPEAQAESLSNIQNSAPCAGTTVTLRVAEARVEDVGHAIARLAPADLLRLGAKPGDVLKITGGTVAVGRADISDDAHEGLIQIDGTCRSNCSAGLQEQV